MINTLIGNTPLIKIKYKYEDKINYIYAKLEFYNLTGSIKDRVAYYMIKNAIQSNTLKPNMTLVEATSGNTGIALSAIGKYYGYKVVIFMPDWVSKERIKLMKMFGAKIFLISKEEGGFISCLKKAKEFAKINNGLFMNQFANKNNFLAHYETTAPEIIKSLNSIDMFISGVGSGGTIMGIGQKLKENNNKCKIIAIEPDKMPLLSKGIIKGTHKIEGIGDDFIPKLLNKKIIDKVITINDNDAINMSKKFANTLGLGIGISSGANFLGAVLANINKKNNKCVTIFADDNKKYISTELSEDMQNSAKFISNKVKLLEYKNI